ncbi:hypothetical protein [Humisphaera borealis]|uniref:Uncharacterized protein n=1 Tax=Humisphaera borealis TaxID=2807512 RepID=A0A7M2WUD6_9BACT|nr:hypothetical protein [Humisphaera borealis]QOV88782.1 hypothetical protein IPV69_21520 [Humisphaera borealis]
MPLAHFEAIDLSDSSKTWIVVALMFPGAVIVFGLMITYLLRRPGKLDEPSPGEPGYYRVLGLDATTGLKRESLIHADSRQSAEGQARLQGIVVTEIEPAGSPDEPV